MKYAKTWGNMGNHERYGRLNPNGTWTFGDKWQSKKVANTVKFKLHLVGVDMHPQNFYSKIYDLWFMDGFPSCKPLIYRLFFHLNNLLPSANVSGTSRIKMVYSGRIIELNGGCSSHFRKVLQGHMALSGNGVYSKIADCTFNGEIIGNWWCVVARFSHVFGSLICARGWVCDVCVIWICMSETTIFYTW